MLQYCNNGSWCEHIYYCESRRACKLVENMLDYKYSNSSRLCTKTQLVGTISTILLKMISTRILDPITITCKISTRNGILDETHKISTSLTAVLRMNLDENVHIRSYAHDLVERSLCTYTGSRRSLRAHTHIYCTDLDENTHMYHM